MFRLSARMGSGIVLCVLIEFSHIGRFSYEKVACCNDRPGRHGGGQALAEIAVSGDAKFGIDYNSDPEDNKSKHSFKHEMGVDFTGSGTTDGGLTFGGKAGFDTGDTDLNEGTVFISGSFGTITFGENDSADKLAGGIADVGLNGVGVDDVVEGLYGQTANVVRYDNSFGSVSIAVSAGTAGVVPTEKQYGALFDLDLRDKVNGARREIYPVGADNNIVGYYRDVPGSVGTGIYYEHFTNGKTELPTTGAQNPAYTRTFLAYERAFDLGPDRTVGTADDTRKDKPEDYKDCRFGCETQYAIGMSFDAGGMTVGFGHDSNDTNSLGLGFSTGDISANALYVKADAATGMGGDVSYSMGASTLTLAYAKRNPDAGAKKDAVGVNLSHDLGGGAKVAAGLAKVEDANKASVGLSFTF